MRPLRRSPLYDRLAAKGAVFGTQDRLGARELLPAAGRRAAAATRSTRPAGCRACSTSSARAARTSSSSTRPRSPSSCCKGRDALAVLQRLCANEIDVPVGRMVYTRDAERARRLRERPDDHAARADDASSSSPARRRRRATSTGSSAHIGADERAALVDVTSAYSVLSVMGPKARGAARAAVARRPVAGRRCRSRTTREIDVGYARVRAARMSYVGGPGYELYVPTEIVRHVYDALRERRRRPRPARRRLLHDRRAAHRGRPARLGRRARRPTRRRSRPGLVLRGQARQADGFIGREALRRAPGAAAAQAARHRSSSTIGRRLRLGRRGAARRRRAGRRDHLRRLEPEARRLRRPRLPARRGRGRAPRRHAGRGRPLGRARRRHGLGRGRRGCSARRRERARAVLAALDRRAGVRAVAAVRPRRRRDPAGDRARACATSAARSRWPRSWSR